MQTLAILVALLVANAFFVAAEFALVKARSVRINQLAADGDSAAVRTADIQRDLEPYLAACQLGITMASLGLGWVGEPAVAALLEPALHSVGITEGIHTISFIVGFLLFSSLHIVIGEQVPKTFAIRKSEHVAMLCSWPLRLFFVLAYPLNWALNEASNGLLRLMGVSPATHEEVFTSEELSDLVDQSHRGGALAEHQASMVRNVFQFDERPVSRVMMPRIEVDVLDVDASPQDSERAVRETGHSRLPLVDEDAGQVIGVILVKQLFKALLNGEADVWANLRAYAREPLYVPESQTVSRLFETMRQERAHMAFVMDEYGTLAGIVTLEDLLEEIVGDIEDELDESGSSVDIVQTEHGWSVHGMTSLADLERAVELPVDSTLDVNTISGLAMRRLGRIPDVDDEFEEGGFSVRVVEVAGQRVERVLINDRRTREGAEDSVSDLPIDEDAQGGAGSSD